MSGYIGLTARGRGRGSPGTLKERVSYQLGGTVITSVEEQDINPPTRGQANQKPVSALRAICLSYQDPDDEGNITKETAQNPQSQFSPQQGYRIPEPEVEGNLEEGRVEEEEGEVGEEEEEEEIEDEEEVEDEEEEVNSKGQGRDYQGEGLGSISSHGRLTGNIHAWKSEVNRKQNLVKSLSAQNVTVTPSSAPSRLTAVVHPQLQMPGTGAKSTAMRLQTERQAVSQRLALHRIPQVQVRHQQVIASPSGPYLVTDMSPNMPRQLVSKMVRGSTPPTPLPPSSIVSRGVSYLRNLEGMVISPSRSTASLTNSPKMAQESESIGGEEMGPPPCKIIRQSVGRGRMEGEAEVAQGSLVTAMRSPSPAAIRPRTPVGLGGGRVIIQQPPLPTQPPPPQPPPPPPPPPPHVSSTTSSSSMPILCHNQSRLVIEGNTENPDQLVLILPRIAAPRSFILNPNWRNITIENGDQGPYQVLVTPNRGTPVCLISTTPSQPSGRNIGVTNSGVSRKEEEKSSNGEKLRRTLPLMKEGKSAVCPHCGQVSQDFNTCVRCRRPLPPDVKEIPDSLLTKKGKEGVRSLGSPQSSLRVFRKQRKPYRDDEPELLTLSSDDEERGDRGKQAERDRGQHGDGVRDGYAECDAEGDGDGDGDGGDANEKEKEEGDRILSEPFPANPEEEEEEDGEEEEEDGNGRRDDHTLDQRGGGKKGEHQLVTCHSIRFGSYKIIPRDPVRVSQAGFHIVSPIYGGPGKVEVDVPMSGLLGIWVCLSDQMPVLFLYCRPRMAARISSLLQLDKSSQYRFDPCSTDDTCKRLTILPSTLTSAVSQVLRSLLSPLRMDKGQTLYSEIALAAANDILVRSSPREVRELNQSLEIPASIQASKQSCLQPSDGKSSAIDSGEPKVMFSWPEPPARSEFSINTNDYMCLEEECFLNDTVIDFYLKYLYWKVLDKEMRERTHIFSSYFYKRLTTRTNLRNSFAGQGEMNPKLSAEEMRHARVKSWTKGVDLFAKDYIVIPINEHSHWFLAIVCFPGLNGPVRASDGQRVCLPAPTKGRSQNLLQKLGKKKGDETKGGKKGDEQVMKYGATVITPVSDQGTGEGGMEAGDSDRDEAEGDEDELRDDSSPPAPVDEAQDPPLETPEKKASKKSGDDGDERSESEEEMFPMAQPNDNIKQPCILIFDSLGQTNRSRIVETLRQYLRVEYKTRHKQDKNFTRDTMKGAIPQVPQQDNFSDCGVFLLQYAEAFFQKPITTFRHPFRGLEEWFNEESVKKKRKELAGLLESLMRKLNPKPFDLPPLHFACDDDPPPSSDAPTESPNNQREIPKPPVSQLLSLPRKF